MPAQRGRSHTRVASGGAISGSAERDRWPEMDVQIRAEWLEQRCCGDLHMLREVPHAVAQRCRQRAVRMGAMADVSDVVRGTRSIF